MLIWKAYLVCLCTIAPFLRCSALVLPSRPLSPSSTTTTTTSTKLLMSEPGQSQSRSQSIWASSQWKVTFNFGREPGTLMSGDWGASGKRLIFDLPVEATSDSLVTDKGEDPMLQRNADKLLPLSSGTYDDDDGRQSNVAFARTGGEWKIQMPRGVSNGKAGKLMCYFDLETPLRKGDLFLDRGERVYLTAKCWREGELDRALERLKPYQQNYRLREEKMNVAVIDKNYGYERLIIDHENSLREYQEANIYFPTIDDDDLEFSWTKQDLEWKEGPWPGEAEWLTVEPLFLMVRRMKFFVKEEYHVIGTWAATPIFEEEAEAEAQNNTA